MHLNPYGEYAVVLAASLANDWPATRTEIETRTRDVGMTMEFDEASDDHALTRAVIDEWLTVVDASDPQERARLLNAQMATASAYPRLTDHDGEGWHLHYRAEEKSLPDVLRSIISVGTALHLTTRGIAPSRTLRRRAGPRGSVLGRRRRHHPQRSSAVLLCALREPRCGPSTPGEDQTRSLSGGGVRNESTRRVRRAGPPKLQACPMWWHVRARAATRRSARSSRRCA